MNKKISLNSNLFENNNSNKNKIKNFFKKKKIKII